MEPRLPPAGRRQRSPVDRLAKLERRLEETDRRVLLLHNTLRGVAREAGVSIGCPCDRCERSYLLVSDGLLVCPQCGYQQSI